MGLLILRPSIRLADIDAYMLIGPGYQPSDVPITPTSSNLGKANVLYRIANDGSIHAVITELLVAGINGFAMNHCSGMGMLCTTSWNPLDFPPWNTDVDRMYRLFITRDHGITWSKITGPPGIERLGMYSFVNMITYWRGKFWVVHYESASVSYRTAVSSSIDGERWDTHVFDRSLPAASIMVGNDELMIVSDGIDYGNFSSGMITSVDGVNWIPVSSLPYPEANLQSFYPVIVSPTTGKEIVLGIGTIFHGYNEVDFAVTAFEHVRGATVATKLADMVSDWYPVYIPYITYINPVGYYNNELWAFGVDWIPYKSSDDGHSWTNPLGGTTSLFPGYSLGNYGGRFTNFATTNTATYAIRYPGPPDGYSPNIGLATEIIKSTDMLNWSVVTELTGIYYTRSYTYNNLLLYASPTFDL